MPTYVINGQWAIPGAQEPETFAKVLRKMADQAVGHQAVAQTVVIDRFVLAHGFTQTARSWSTFAQLPSRAAPRRRDHRDRSARPRHAPPPHDSDLWESADRLVDAGGAATYVGYSMGGRVSLHAALAHPERVRSLVLIGATAGIDDLDERAGSPGSRRTPRRPHRSGRRRHLHRRMARHCPVRRPHGADRAARRPAPQHRRRPGGQPASHGHGHPGTAVGAARRDRRCPCWSSRASTTRSSERSANAWPRPPAASTFEVIAGAGHSVHLEQPEATAAALADWHRLQTT